MKTLWRYLKPQRARMALALAFASVAQLLTLIDPIIFGKIVDRYGIRVIKNPDGHVLREVSLWLAVALGIALLSRLAKATQDFFSKEIVACFGKQIFTDGLRQTLRLSFQEFEDSRSGETVSILQKVKTDTERFVNSFVNVVFSSFVGIGFLIWYSITRSGLIIPIFLVGILLLGTLTGLLSNRIKKIQRTINRQTNKLSGTITESLRNIELVKSLGLTFPEIRRLSDMTEHIYAMEMEKARRVSILSFSQGAALSLLKQSVLFMLLWLIFRGQLSTGELIAMQFISTAIFGPLQDLGNIIVQYREVETSLTTFDHLMQRPIEQRPPDPLEVGDIRTIRFDRVIFRHATATSNAVDDLSFEVRRGETIAFVGPSGSGKSTLLKLLVGLYRPVSGGIYFNDARSSRLRYNPLRRQMGFVTQDTQLFAGTIRENLRLVRPDATDIELIEAMEKAAASNIIRRSPLGLDAVLGEGGIKLSGGEKQRLSIARALVRHPRMLIFDEATSALDSITEEEITNTIRRISADREQITIMIAHRLSTIMHADLIYVLEKGKITETGKHEELLQQKGLYFAMWRQQIGERR
ncbi:MAG TPA: ABC transporter ATP-binding protein [Chryseolinea sp.]|nr:ABC transporter ATP-binding protein [Chryseolinea sp.]